MESRFKLIRFVTAAFRNSPWLVIAVGLHVMLFALMSIIYISHELSKSNDNPTAIAVGKDRTDAPLEVIQPPELIDRKKVPENTDAELVTYEEESFVPTEEPEEEDLYLDIGDPTGTDDAQAGQTGGTAIGVGAGGGHYGAGASPFASRRVGSGKKFGRTGGAKIGTEEAVLEGVTWLIRHQNEDGSWGPDGCRTRCNPKTPCIPPDAEVQPYWNEGLTGLALLAFLGMGLNHDSKNTIVDRARGKEHVTGEVIKKGLKWLVARQQDDGSFTPREVLANHMYNEALATMALCEAYGLSRSAYFKKPAQKGVDFLVAAQKLGPDGSLWGWRYNSRADLVAKKESGEIDDATYYDLIEEADSSVTGWVIMALKSASISGLKVPPEAMEGGLRFAKHVSRADGLVGYLDPSGAGEAVNGPGDQYTYHVGTMSALSMLVHSFVAHDVDDPFLEAAAKQIVKDQPTISKDKLSIDYYYWYYATLALNQFDGPDSPRKSGEYWNKWNESMQDAILELQDMRKERELCARGGWLQNDRWSRQGHAIYNTAINTLTLEVYYRYENAFGAGVRERAGPAAVEAVQSEEPENGSDKGADEQEDGSVKSPEDGPEDGSVKGADEQEDG